jgi:hypothetical protein
MVGLHYLKHAFDESDESVVVRLLENPYWQYYCGFKFFLHWLPLDPSSLVRWRKRIGPKQMEQLLTETLETAKREEHLSEQHMERVNVDTTVQEKAIAYPTDARLYHKARVLLVKAAKKAASRCTRAWQAGFAQVRPLCPCTADATCQGRAEEGQVLPWPGVPQHPAQLPETGQGTGEVAISNSEIADPEAA